MIYILGGNGFVGSAFARYFDVIGQAYCIIDRENYASHIGDECDVLINANGNSKKFLANKDPKWEFQASVASVRNSLVDFKFKKYVFLSTSDIYADCSDTVSTLESLPVDACKLSPYGFHKYLAEQCVQYAAKDWLIIRMGGFVGPGLKKNAVYDVLHSDKLWVNPDSRFQFINTDDSARLIMALIAKDITGEVFNLTAKGTVSVRDIMAIAGRWPDSDSQATALTYEISTAKVEQHLVLPATEETIAKFLVDGSF